MPLMRSRLRPFSLAVAVLLTAGCSSSSGSNAAAPSTIAKPATSGAPSGSVAVPGYDQSWSLTTIVTRVDGSNCVVPTSPGAIGTGTMLANQAGSSVKFLYWASNYPTDDVEYMGSVGDDGSFVAKAMAQPVKFPSCSDEGTFQGTLTGQFSADRRQLTATETWSYHFGSGDLTFTFSWTASRN